MTRLDVSKSACAKLISAAPMYRNPALLMRIFVSCCASFDMDAAGNVVEVRKSLERLGMEFKASTTEVVGALNYLRDINLITFSLQDVGGETRVSIDPLFINGISTEFGGMERKCA